MPKTSFTVSSGSERVVVFPEGHSSRSASVHSPTSSESRSFTSSNESEEWTRLEAPYEGEEDDIEPSDSASRSKQSRSRRHTTEARPAPVRRPSSRRVPSSRERDREELPRQHSTHHRHHSSREPRHHRSQSRRTASDESASSVASPDDYPYGHHGMPPPRGYPPPSGYRHVPAPAPPHAHGGYPPSMTGPPGYAPDHFAQQAQALVHMPHQGHTDPFGYPSSNPFSPGAGPQSNPFSPLGSTGGTSYFNAEPQAPPMHHMPQQRPGAPSQRHSMYAPSSAGYPGAEMAPYQHPMYPPYMPGYPQMPYMYPPSQTASPAPPPAKDEKNEEMQSLRDLIKKHEEERVARERAMIAKVEADAAALASARAKEEEEKKKMAEIAAASALARAEAEKAAEESAKKVKEESDAKLKEAEEASKKAKEESEKKLADAKKAKEEVEKKKKELEEEIKKNAPTPDSLKPPIHFKDALNRKFSFPWHLCKTWKGMDGLIKQAFVHVEKWGDHVYDGHYDLMGPDGQIILPQVWDTMVQPDWEVTMHMWPIPEDEKEKKKKDKHANGHGGIDIIDDMGDPFAGMGLEDLLALDAGKISSKKDGKKASGSGAAAKAAKQSKRQSGIIEVPMASSHRSSKSGGIPPPPSGLGGLEALLAMPGGLDMIGEEQRPKSKPRSKSNKDVPFLASWIAGSRKKK